MRKSSIVILGIGIMTALPMAAKQFSPINYVKDNFLHKVSETPRYVRGASWKASELPKLFKPTVTKTFGWDGKNWVQEDIYTYTYDFSGNPVKEVSVDSDGAYVSIEYEYDANGKVIFKESKVSSDGKTFDNYKRNEREYDPILTDVITKNSEWLWMGKEWQQNGNNYTRTIVRDAAGNITSVVIAVLFKGEYDPTQRVEITYGDDGKATSISEQILNYDGRDFFWQQGIKITDIKWKDTDGQICNAEDIFIGNNRISSAHIYDTDDTSMDVKVEYADDSAAYKMTMEGEMEQGSPVTAIVEYTPLENDGYVVDATTFFMGEATFSSHEEIRYDSWGHMTLSHTSETEDGKTYGEKITGAVEYGEDGMPVSYTVSGEYEEPGHGVISENIFRAEYSGYVDVTASVSGIEAGNDSAVRYFNLQGVPVEHPAKGSIVIRKQGGNAMKIRY